MHEADKIATQERVVFEPVSGQFDLERIAEAIGGMGFSFQDPAEPRRYVIASDEESRDVFEARRRADPKSRLPYVPIVLATPDRVVFAPMVAQEALREISVGFTAWMLETYACKVSDGAGTDLLAPADDGDA